MKSSHVTTAGVPRGVPPAAEGVPPGVPPAAVDVPPGVPPAGNSSSHKAA